MDSRSRSAPPRSDSGPGDYLCNRLLDCSFDVFDRDSDATASAVWSKIGVVSRGGTNADLLAVWRVQLVVSSK